MITRQLGATDLHITIIGFGSWAVGGGDYAFGWGPQDDDDSVAAIRRAVDAGINWIDTAPVYGLGRAEHVVARALKELGSSRRPYLFTKCSLVWEGGAISHTLKAASLRKEVDDSLRRLGCETIDLYQIHWPAMPGSGDPDSDIEEGWDTLLEIQRAGKVRHIGVSNFSVPQLERIRGRGTLASLQPQYSMLSRKIEPDVLPYCQARNVGVIVYSPMAAGLLSGSMTRERAAALPASDWRANHPYFKEPRLSQYLALVEVLRDIGAAHGGASPGAVAIAWTLSHPAVTAAIVGFRNADQVDGPAAAASLDLTEADVAAIEAELGKLSRPA